MSIRTKKARRWNRRLAAATRKRDGQLAGFIEHTRRLIAHQAQVNNWDDRDRDRLTEEAVNQTIVHTPQSLIFRAKARARKGLYAE